MMVNFLATVLMFTVVAGSKRDIKEIYQPFGPEMCKELNKDSKVNFNYTVERLSCHRNTPTYPTQRKTDSKLMTRKQKSELLAVLRKNEHIADSPEENVHLSLMSAQTSSHNLLLTTPSTLIYTQNMTTKKRGVADANSPRLEHESATDSSGTEEMAVFRHNPNLTLHKACALVRLDEVKYILSKELEDINCQDETGRTPVMVAASKGRNSVFNFLQRQDCNLSIVSKVFDNILHFACEGGNVDIVRKLTDEHNLDIDSRGCNGWTPLMFAVSSGHRDVVDLLVQRGCDIVAADKFGRNVLHIACRGGNLQTVKYILRNKFVFKESRDHHGRTALLSAAGRGHVNVFRYLVSSGCDMTLTDDNGHNILHIACLAGHIAMVKYVLRLKRPLMVSRDHYRKTAVMLAAEFGHREVFDLLVSYRCNLQVTDKKQNNILHVACISGYVDIIKYIIKHNLVDIDAKTSRGSTAIIIAAYKGHIEVYDLLARNECDLWMVDDLGNNVLHHACAGGHVRMVEHIIRQNIFDIEGRGTQNRTPLLISAEHGHREVFDFLVSKGCDTKALDKSGNNILHLACISGNVDMVKYIIKEIIADIESRGCFDKTALLFAVEQGHKEVVDLLVLKGCSLSARDKYNNSILHMACLGGSVAMVEYVISKNVVDIYCKGIHGRTPVLSAALMGHVKVVDFLFRNGYDMKSVDVHRNNILHVACIGGHVRVVKYIISKHIVHIDSKGFRSRTSVMSAAVMGNVDVVDLLLREGCDIHTVDVYGNNILHLACIGGHVPMVKYLIKQGIIPGKVFNGDRMTPVDLAKVKGHGDVVALFKDRG